MKRRWSATAVGIVFLGFVAGLAQAVTYTVTSSGDAATGGTLRWAIRSAATNSGADIIDFDSAYTIFPTGTLPQVVDRTTVDATTSGGRVTLNGQGIITNGLILAGRSNVVKGLLVTRFVVSGILVFTADYCRVEGCLVLSNVDDGVELEYSANNVIGGTNEAQRNVISANGKNGVYLWRASSTNNVICGNFIGVSTNGRSILSNAYDGIVIYEASRNTVGGTNANFRNIISGNMEGVWIDAPAHHNVIAGNFIGADVTGSNGLPNMYGVVVTSSNNMIGSSAAGGRNIISGNTYDGVVLLLADSWSNTVLGNYIGTDMSGARALGNGDNGIRISNDAWKNTVGGTNAGAGNVISGNEETGVRTMFGSHHNTLFGNLIGLNAAGTAPLSNRLWGVRITSPSNTVGGLTAAARNVVSGNGSSGIWIESTNGAGCDVFGNYVGTDITGSNAVPNVANGISVSDAANCEIGAASGGGNLASGNGSQGISVSGSATGTVVRCNYVGTDASGRFAIPNGAGIHVDSPGTVVGGVGYRNIVSGNLTTGIGLGSGTVVQANYIGVNVTGLSVLSNGSYSVDIWQVPRCQVGGTNAGEGNVICGGSIAGVRIYGSNAVNNVLEGNFIGTDVDGMNALGNGIGVLLDGAWSNRIGGRGMTAGNVISGNRGSGVEFRIGAMGNMVQRNSIGTDVSVGGPLANGGDGVCVDSSWRNWIGGQTNEGNVIAGNLSHGVKIRQSNSVWNLVQGNYIGCNMLTTSIGNAGAGVCIENDAATNWVGGQFDGSGNVIAFNSQQGIYISGDLALGNIVARNAIFANGALGIDLSPAGVQPNDKEDPDVGPNRYQNYPVVLAASNNGVTLQIVGMLNSMKGHPYHIELFGSRNLDISGYGQGEVYLGGVDGLNTDPATGDRGFTNVFVVPDPPPNYITATAMDQGTLDTSEFSRRFILDSDSDGMPDGWEFEQFGDYQAGNPMADVDTDGVVNVSEFIGDTDPWDSNSVMRISAVWQAGATTLVSWGSSLQRKYACNVAVFMTNQSSWSQVGGISNGTGGTITMGDSSGAASSRFWRVEASIP